MIGVVMEARLDVGLGCVCTVNSMAKYSAGGVLAVVFTRAW